MDTSMKVRKNHEDKYEKLTLILEKDLGLRVCFKCNKILPLEAFKPNTQINTCREHLRETQRRFVVGTPARRAFNCLRCKARADSIAFGQKSIKFSFNEMTKILTEKQIQDYAHYSVIPLRPNETLSVDNHAVVTVRQRKYIMTRWQESKDAEQYKCDVACFL